MAKARKVTDIRCSEAVLVNARRIISVRLDEMLSFAGWIQNRHNTEEIHNLRIAAKRLRYTLEMFRFAFPSGLKPFITEVKEIQEAVGNMRDADVMIERVRSILAGRSAARSEKLLDIATSIERGTVAQRRQRIQSAMVTPTGTRDDLAYYTLIAYRAEDSERAYQQFLAAWERMTATDFAGRLRRFVGIERPAVEREADVPKDNGNDPAIMTAGAATAPPDRGARVNTATRTDGQREGSDRHDAGDPPNTPGRDQ